jgi:CarboxypepD_reg-like domain/TonB-dependent Receptor Plug Domain
MIFNEKNKIMKKRKFYLIGCMLLFLLEYVGAQGAFITGQITDAESGEAIEFATISIRGSKNSVTSNERGLFTLAVAANERMTLVVRRVAFKEATSDILPLASGARFGLDIALAPVQTNLEVTISERRLDDGGMQREKNMSALKLLPSASGNLESILPHIAMGLNTGGGGELTSQYQVRGGNYDENLVYINDFEIYRPQLIRAGQQEGLSFPNIDLVRDLSFSSGGFQAKYGEIKCRRYLI